MAKPWYTITAAAEGSEFAEISILDAIHAWYGVNAQSFLTEFRALKAQKVKVYINSPGGNVIEALAMFNGMRATGKHIEVHVLGIAASAASYIAMAGDKVVMPKNTLMFLHNPIADPGPSNADEMREQAGVLDKIGAMLTSTYAKRWKGEEKALTDLLAAESLLTADECLAHGFCDEVTDEIAATAEFDVDTLPPAARALFKAVAAVPARKAPTPSAVLAEDVAALAKDAGLEVFAPVFLTDPSVVSMESAALAVHAAREIKALATHTGLPDHADALIRSRKTVVEARASLAEALAEADAERRVDTASPSKPLQGAATASWSPTSLWTEIKAMKAGSKK
jgi:ATP-dependent Clp protease protease subunit